MIDSVRQTVPDSIPIEFIIADNASNDGTWEWLQSQDDIVSIQMGSPVGAIKAFTEAGKMAQGKYALIATDDIYFPEGAIIKALGFLDSTPSSGAVTFKHNKNRDSFEAAYVHVTFSDGIKEARPYTQISLVRTDLANECGWWGGDDEIMSQGFTYGGDNFLSAGIWERGYTVDTVNGAHNIEDVFQDDGRKMNEDRHRMDSELYFTRYPEIHAPAGVQHPDNESLRILLLLHYSPGHKSHKSQKLWMKTGLQNIGIVFDYDFAGATAQKRNINYELSRICEDFNPQLIVSQMHQPSHGFTAETARTLRTYAPGSVMINWNGDVWEKNILHSGTQDILRHYDLCLFSNAQLSRTLATMGYNTGFLPEGFEPECIEPDTSQPSYDVLFTGTGYSDWRIKLMKHVQAMPYNTAIYGRAKGIETKGETMWDWSLTRGLYHNAKIVISDQQFPEARGYVSKRMWEIMASGGGIVLQQFSEELDALTGLEDGVHYRSWRTLEELSMLVDYYIGHDDERQTIAKDAYEYVWQDHSHEQRACQIIEYVKRLSWQSAPV
jgi:glycosyltransferase involved in cell wall biosynthesis